MSTDKDKASAKRMSAAQCLASLKPLPPKYRFLISWDPRKGVLRFGCGYGEKAVFVCSNHKLESAVWTDDSVPKLLPASARRFVESRAGTVDGLNLLGRCHSLLQSYVHLHDDRVYTLFTVWSIATYLYPLFSHFGYLFLHSKFPRSGKSRVEELLSHLCFEATVPLNSPTVPSIRESAAEGHTVVLDTLERWKGKNPESHSAAMELLDAGFRNGGTVVKMISIDGQWRKQMIPVYAPYVLAAIKKESLADTALDRSFVIEMHRKPYSLKKKKYSYFRCEQECSLLRDDLYRWALMNAARVAALYESAQLEAEVDALELNDRAADIWTPLFAVAKVLGSTEAWQQLTSLAVEMGRDPEAGERETVRAIVSSLRKFVNGNGTAVGTTSDFVQHLSGDGLEVSESDLHDQLSQWGFSQASVRLPQGPRRAWQVSDSQLEEIERENSPVPPSQNATTVTTTQESKT